MIASTNSGKTHGASCLCPACQGLQCLERPRYFSGQLLTETELNNEQAYMLAKQRLHNRYLHGSGVVCGLQVTCSDCAGFATVQSGYALDPCGNDIIVCNTQEFNVIKRIAECDDARRRRRGGNCNPLMTAQDVNCKDIERHFCLTIAYEETLTRATNALRYTTTTSSTSSKSCGCRSSAGSTSSGCGCGGSQSTTTSTATAQSSQASISCEPTRIAEGYNLDIVEVPADYCGDLKDILQGTLLEKVINCVTSVRTFLDQRLPASIYRILMPLVFSSSADASAEEIHEACCRLRQAVYELYEQNPLNAHCGALDLFKHIRCPHVPCREEGAEELSQEEYTLYIERVRVTLYHLLALLLQYILDCICQALLPPCPPSAADDRLILACMTVKDNKIVDICDFCHRQYAGSFPAVSYWLSLAPIIPLIAYAVNFLCCTDWLSPRLQDRGQEMQAGANLTNKLTQLLDQIDPSTSLRKAIFADNFAVPRTYATRFEAMIKGAAPSKLTDQLHAEAFNLATIMGKSVADATAAMSAAGVIPIVHEVASAGEAPLLRPLTTPPFARAGDEIVVYHAGDTVVSYATHTPTPEIGALRSNMEALRANLTNMPQVADIDAIKTDVAAVRTNLANVPQPEELNAVRTDVEALKSGLAEAPKADEVAGIKADVVTLQDSLKKVPQTEELDAVKTTIASLQDTLTKVPQTEELNVVKADVETLKTNLTKMPQTEELDAVKANVETLKSGLAEVPKADEVAGIKADVATLQDSLTKVPQTEELNAVKTTVAALEDSLAKVPQTEEFNAVKTDVETLKTDLTKVPQPAELTEVRDTVVTLKHDLDNVTQAVGAAPPELTDMQAALKTLTDEIATLRAEIDKLKANGAPPADQPPQP